MIVLSSRQAQKRCASIALLFLEDGKTCFDFLSITSQKFGHLWTVQPVMGISFRWDLHQDPAFVLIIFQLFVPLGLQNIGY